MVRATELTIWGAVCLGVWLLTLSSVTVADLSLAIPAGLLCGLLATGGRRLAGGQWRVRRRWGAWLLTLPAAIIIDTLGVWRVAARAALGHGSRGRTRLVQLPIDESEDVAATRRAVATLALSAAPGFYVVDFDPDRRELLVHTLADSAPAWARLDTSR